MAQKSKAKVHRTASPPLTTTTGLAARFLALTPGASATRWLSLALASRGDVFVSLGHHLLDSIFKGDILSPKARDDDSYFVSGQHLADFYAHNSLDGIFAAYQRVMPGAAALGNVGGFSVTRLLEKARPLGKLQGINLVNLTCHPVLHIDAHFRLVQQAKAHPQVYKHYAEKMYPQALERIPEIKTFSRKANDQFLAFVVGCYSAFLAANEHYFPFCRHQRTEDLTSDLAALTDFCQTLTGLEYGPQHLEPLLARDDLKHHRADQGGQDPRQVHQSWAPWQQDLARLIFSENLVDQTEALGYELDMLRPRGWSSPPVRPPVGPPVEPVDDELGRLFAAGNYAGVILMGRQDRWEHHAALGLIGRTDEAIAGLQSFTHQQARFYEGVALWIGERDQEALACLRQVPSEHAQNLCALLLKPRIEVLSQMPGERALGSSDFASFLPMISRFRVRNISAHMVDLPPDPEAAVEDYLEPEGPPDFFIAKMVEWNLLPANLVDLDCPIFGHTGDYDLHIQATLPWLRLFDELVVTDQTEWADVSRLTPAPVSTFPKTFGVKPDLPPLPQGDRSLYVFQSGTLLHPYHPDKVPSMLQALGLPLDNQTWVADCFMRTDQYYQVLGNTRATYTFVRHPGAMPTRGLEALAMGCAVVTQEGSSLTLFAGEEEGVLTYDRSGDSLRQALSRITGNWAHFKPRARKGAQIIRQEFNLPKVASQYLRYLTFLAAKPRPLRRSRPAARPELKRMVMVKGWLPGGTGLVERVTRANQARWEARLRDGSADLATYLDLGRELVLQNLYDRTPRAVSLLGAPARRHDLMRGLEVMRQGLTNHADSLALRFNFIRACLHLGRPPEVREGLELLVETLASPVEAWRLAPMDDVFPWDCFTSFFNYRAYFDLVTRHFTHGEEVKGELIKLILASLWHYYARYSKDQSHAARAASLDPGFCFYRYDLAKALLAAGGAQNIALAGDILTQVASEMLLFEEAYATLEKLEKQGLYQSKNSRQLARFAQKLQQSRQISTTTGGPKAQMQWKDFVLQPCSGSLPQPGPMPVYRGSRDPQEQLSILLPTLNRPEFLWRALNHYHRLGFRGWIIIGDSSQEEILAQNRRSVAQLASNLKLLHLHLPSPPYLHDGMCQKEMVRRAVTPYVVYAGDDDLLVPPGLERCVEFLETHPDFIAAHGIRANVSLENDQVWGKVTRAHLILDPEMLYDLATARLESYLRAGFSTQYYVHRREAWRTMYDQVGRVPLRYLGPELLPCCLSALQGKIKALEHLTVVFQEHEDKVFSIKKNLLIDLLNHPDWARSIACIQEQVTEFLGRNDGVDPAEAGRIFHRELWLHVTRILIGQYNMVHEGKEAEPPINQLPDLLRKNYPLHHSFMLALPSFSKPVAAAA